MARRILSAYNLLNGFVERNKNTDSDGFFSALRNEVKDAEIGDSKEGYFIDIIYGDYIFTAYKVNGRWELSGRAEMLASDDNGSDYFIINMNDIHND